MKFVLAPSIYPPEIGGPSFYAKNLADALAAQGHAVDVVRYGALKKFPSGVRHILFAIKILFHLRAADAIIAFDTYTTGFPAAIAGLIARVPVFARVGGDFVWELYTGRTANLVPIARVYDMNEQWSFRERGVFALSVWVSRHATLVFTSAWIRDIWKDVYRLDPSRIRVIENAIPPGLESKPPKKKNFLFYTRQIPLKNADAFSRAFEAAKGQYPDISLEEGLVPQDELMRRMQECYAVVLPSISDVTPNYILDAIRCKKPFLLTKYSGYAERFKDYGVIVDPFSEDDMARGVRELADDAVYARLVEKLRGFNEVRTYETIAQEFAAIVRS